MRRLLLSSSIALACFSLSVLAEAQAPAAPSDAGVATDAAVPSTAEAPATPSAPNVASDPAPAAPTPGEPAAPTPDEPAAPTPGEPAESEGAPASEATPAGDEGLETPYGEEDGESAQPNVLEPPNLSPLDVPARGAVAADPIAAADRLEQDAPPVPEKKGWSLPETVFHLHGYMRLRGTFLRDGALGHRPYYDRPRNPNGVPTQLNGNYDPFPFFAPDDSTNRTRESMDAPVSRGCGDGPRTDDGRCDKRGQVSGDLRFRIKPEVHLSDDVRVKAWIDVLDNVGMGTLGYGPYQSTELSMDSALRARRVWGEARNRDIGELRFGRMGADWGLGIVDNGGDRLGIDSDFSTEVDRIMGMTNLAGFYLMAAYDWASEGKVLGRTQSPSGVPLDVAQKDDLDAFTFSVARKLDKDVQQSAIARGETVFNYGLYFIYRKQLLQPRANLANLDTDTRYVRINQQQFVPDLWLQLFWEGLRVELEAAMVAGSVEGQCPGLERGTGENRWAGGPETRATNANGAPSETFNRDGECKFRQFGAALELEYRLFDERLGLHLMSGFASGDSQAYGLAATNDPSLQKSSGGTTRNRTVSTFGFHPDYRIDLILWRTLMRRVAGAYYFKPGVSYDFIRDPYGQLAGARVDAIYSRASNPSQTWGDDGNLGLEVDLSLYYRSEDGPDALDGFYGLVQFGVLFPFAGLGYAFPDAPDSRNAMILRGVAGIAF